MNLFSEGKKVGGPSCYFSRRRGGGGLSINKKKGKEKEMISPQGRGRDPDFHQSCE